MEKLVIELLYLTQEPSMAQTQIPSRRRFSGRIEAPGE
jgi:hypothetical protein